VSRHCGSCGRPIEEHPVIGRKARKRRFCPLKRARTGAGKPPRYVYDPKAAKAAQA